MIRHLTIIFAAGMALLGAARNCAAQGGAVESFPVVHNEPLTVCVLSGRSGQPLAHLHLLIIGGYDRGEMHDQLFRQETLTDAQGKTRLAKRLAQLPWLQVWVNKKPLCQTHPRTASFSVDLIRRDGLSSPNRCGTATVVDTPGVFTVFVDGKAKNAAVESIESSATMQTPIATEAFAQKPVEAAAPAQKPTESVLNSLASLPAAGAAPPNPASSPTAAPSTLVSPSPAMPGKQDSAATILPVAAASLQVPEATASPQVKKASKAGAPAKTASATSATAPSHDATSVTAHDAATAPTHHEINAPARVRARQTVTRVAVRRAAQRRTGIQARRPARRVAGRPAAHRARVVLASCPVRQRSTTPTPATRAKAQSKLPESPAAADGGQKTKPAAGVKQKADGNKLKADAGAGK